MDEEGKDIEGENRGGGDSVHVYHMAEGMREGKRERNVDRDATLAGESKMAYSCFIGPLRLVLVTDV